MGLGIKIRLRAGARVKVQTRFARMADGASSRIPLVQTPLQPAVRISGIGISGIGISGIGISGVEISGMGTPLVRASALPTH
jgi:hypothetical protein